MALGPNDVFQPFRIKRRMFPWLVPRVPSRETASMPEYDRHFRWIPHWSSGPLLLVRVGVRVAVRRVLPRQGLNLRRALIAGGGSPQVGEPVPIGPRATLLSWVGLGTSSLRCVRCDTA